MRLVSISLFVAAGLAVAGQSGMAGAAPPAGADWVLTFNEDFDGPMIDPSIWSVSSGQHLRQRDSDPANVVLSDHVLHLISRHHLRGGQEWTSAGLWTRNFRQAFGYFEARVRYARATGMTNVFRLVTDQPISAGGFDIAVDEGRYPCVISMQLRRPGFRGLFINQMTAATDLSSDYHLYGLAWLPNRRGSTTLTWYVDGAPVQTAVCAQCTRPARLWLGTQVITGSGPFAPPPSGASMDVDYVRVYQLHNLSERRRQ